ncbi:MAG: hypothetical protein IJ023_04225 [Bacteroidales bacterium]|nr:hypothetical protein [Bacteroidales bacterium]
MDNLARFISDHMGDDTSRLLLAKDKWPDIDMQLAVNCIESRRKLKGKVNEWHDNPSLIFPVRLSAEQCSSSATAQYKASLADRIMAGGEWKIADLTGGLGVDSWFFSQKAEKVLYNEMQTVLCDSSRHNFKALGADNIEVSNAAVGNSADETSSSALLGDFRPDIIYMDPARRGEGGRKVFLIEECTPDILTLKEELFTISRHILVKLSPMADISMACGRLGPCCREVHIVATGGECKELLIWMDREWNGEYSVHAIELPAGYPLSEPAQFSFMPSEELALPFILKDDDNTPMYLFEPGKALMKAGAFNLISTRFGIPKLGRSTHFYVFDDPEKIQEIRGSGKIYQIMKWEPLNKRSMKEAGKDFPKAEVTARNIPMDTDTLRKKLGVTSGDDAHIFGLKSDSLGNLLLCTNRVF